jgi:hypothetical protein
MRASLAVALREYNGRASQYRHVFDAGVRIIFNYSEGLRDTREQCTVHTSNPAVELLHAVVIPPRLRLMNLVLAAGGIKLTS